MVDRPTDESLIEKLYKISGSELFGSDLMDVIKCAIKELYYSGQDAQDTICKLRPHHLDRAIHKYKQASGKRHIQNTKQYFKACVLSAISESGLDEFDPNLLDTLD